MEIDRRAFLVGAAALVPINRGRVPSFRPHDFGRVQGDATAAIVAAHAECVRNGGGTIIIDQRLECTSARRNGHSWTTLELFADNLTIEFVGDGELVFPRRGLVNYRPIVIGGTGKTGAPLEQSRCIDVPVTPLATAADRGARELLLDGNSTMQAGDIAFVRSGQLLPGRTDEPDAELVEIAGVDGERVLLASPLSKSYTLRRCEQAAPFGIAYVTNRVSRNIRLLNPRITTAESLQALSIWSVFGFASIGGQLTYDFLGAGARDACRVRWTTRLHHTGRTSVNSYSLAPSTGCTRWEISLDAVSPGFSYMHLHEGVADTTLFGRIKNGGGAGERNPALSIAARSRFIRIPYLSVDTGRSEQPAILADGSAGRVDLGDIEVWNASNLGSAIRLDTDQVRLARKPRMLGSNQIVKRLPSTAQVCR